MDGFASRAAWLRLRSGSHGSAGGSGGGGFSTALRPRRRWGPPGGRRGSGPRRAGRRPWPGPRSAFLGTLDSAAGRHATFSFTQAERLNWHYVPRRREGLPLKDMTADGPRRRARLAAGGALGGRLRQGARRHPSRGSAPAARDVRRLQPGSRQLRGHDLRDARPGGALGVAVRGPPSLAQLHGRPRPGGRGHPRVPRRESGGGAVGPPEGAARPSSRAGSRPGSRREPRSGRSAHARRSGPSRSATS